MHECFPAAEFDEFMARTMEQFFVGALPLHPAGGLQVPRTPCAGAFRGAEYAGDDRAASWVSYGGAAIVPARLLREKWSGL